MKGIGTQPVRRPGPGIGLSRLGREHDEVAR